MMKINVKYFGLIVVLLLSLCSCTSINNSRRLKKFVSRFNEREYACASTYIYPGDRMQLAFFANEVRSKAPNAFIEIDDTDTEDGYMIATLKWKNANSFLRNYFANIGMPLDKDDVLIDTFRVRETLDGDCFSFDWGSPELNSEKLRLASISSDSVQQMNIREGAGIDYPIIGKLHKGKDILIVKSENGWSRCYMMNSDSKLQMGYIYTANMSIKESAFFTLGIFDSLGLLVAMIVVVVICVPLYYLRGVVEAIMRSGCVGMAVCVTLILGLICVIYQLIEKILFELFIINLPY